MQSREEILSAMSKHAQMISHPLDLHDLAEQISKSKIVMLGEASHGTSEFYSYRAILSEILIREYGFDFVAVEGDWPDATRLRKYIQKGEGKNAHSVLSKVKRWPLWMWANEEVVSFAEVLRHHQSAFYGLDVYSLYESIAEVERFLKLNNPKMLDKIQERYQCLGRYEGNEISYTKSLLAGESSCEKEVTANLKDLLKIRLENEHDEELFDAQQNARVVIGAEKYYRTMLQGGAESWNARDHHMQDTLEQLLDHHGKQSKAIVWAHNTHIGDYRATDMWGDGYVNLGGLARQKFGAENVALVGFGTYQGSVVASHAWGAREEKMNLPPAKEGTLEDYCHQTAMKLKSKSYYFYFDDEVRKSALSSVLGHRAVGVVYQPKHENRSQYVPTIVTERYDAFVYIDRTQGLQSLAGKTKHGLFPETWPEGQ
jgi:erythromycin esterase-like protein